LRFNVPVLTPDQFEQLQRILSDAFDRRGIAELVRTKLGDRLDKLVGPDQPTPGIVFDLLTWIDKRDVHTLEILLQGAIAMKPENGALRAFCEHDVPGALKPIDSQVYASEFPTKVQGAQTSEMGLLGFLRDNRNHEVLGWLGGGLVVAVAVLWAFIYFLPAVKSPEAKSREPTPSSVQANCGGVAVGGNVTGATITAGSTTNSDCAPKLK
jgi:Effector-associated domain 1